MKFEVTIGRPALADSGLGAPTEAGMLRYSGLGDRLGERVDAEGVAVADAADLEKGEVEPAGGGDGGGAAGKEQNPPKWQ